MSSRKIEPEKIFASVINLKMVGISEQIFKNKVRANVKAISSEADKLESGNQPIKALEYRFWAILLALEIPVDHNFISVQIRRAGVLFDNIPENTLIEQDFYQNPKFNKVKRLLVVENNRTDEFNSSKDTEDELRQQKEAINLFDKSTSLLRKNFTAINKLTKKINDIAESQNNSVDSEVQALIWKIKREEKALEIWKELLVPKIEQVLASETDAPDDTSFEDNEFKRNADKILQLLSGSRVEYKAEIFSLIDQAKKAFEKKQEALYSVKHKENVEKIQAEGKKKRRSHLETLTRRLGNEEENLEELIKEIQKGLSVLQNSDVESDLYEAIINWLNEIPILILRRAAWDLSEKLARDARETKFEIRKKNYNEANLAYWWIRNRLNDLNGLIANLSNEEAFKEGLKGKLQKASDNLSLIGIRFTKPQEPQKGSLWHRFIAFFKK